MRDLTALVTIDRNTEKVVNYYPLARGDTEEQIICRVMEPLVQRSFRRWLALRLLPWVGAVVTRLPYRRTSSLVLDRLQAIAFHQGDTEQ
mgnify:CR=1 FL=1